MVDTLDSTWSWVHRLTAYSGALALTFAGATGAMYLLARRRLRSGDATLHRYLRRSVNEFDGAAAFRDRLRANGFTSVRSETMPGWQRNVVHTFLGQAPQ